MQPVLTRFLVCWWPLKHHDMHIVRHSQYNFWSGSHLCKQLYW